MKNDVIKRTLSNGINVYLYVDESLKRVVASYNVNYGTLGFFDRFYYDEKPYSVPPAMAHFLEHTLVETAKEGNMLLKFKEKSYETNAVTGLEWTSFYFVGIKDTWEAIKQLIKMVDEPNFDAENIEKVKNAVIEEANMKMDSKYQHGRNANRRNATLAYEACHESYNILGTGETTKSITLEDVRVCYDAYYYNDNKCLVIGGNFDVEEMIDYLEKVYEEIPSHPKKMREMDYGDLLPIRKTYEELDRPVANDYVITSFKMRNDFKKEKIVVDLYLYIFLRMKFGSDMDFVMKLAHDKIIIGGVGHSCFYFKDTLTITFSADVLDEEKFMKRLKGELNSNGLDERLFELIKRTLKVNELSKKDAIYKKLLGFHTQTEFTEKLYNMDIIDKLNLEELKEIVDSIDWNLQTTCVIRAYKNKEQN